MKEKLEQLLYFGLGSALLAKEKIDKAGESTRGLREESDRKAREFFQQAVAKGGEEREELKGKIKELMKEVIDELGVATREDLDGLREELARLRRGEP